MSGEVIAALAERLQLKRPLAFLDLESTGLNPDQDRIVEIAVLKLWPDGRVILFSSLVNPGVPIPADVVALHGITDTDVATAPPFAALAPTLADEFTDTDLGGYNVRRYDLRLLAAEFRRAAVPFNPDDHQVVDPYEVFAKREARDLAAAVKFYLNRDERPAHRAMADVIAAVQVLAAQLDRYPDLPSTVAGLHDYRRDPTWVDPDGKIRWRNGVAVIAFGRCNGTTLQDLNRDYINWMLAADFSPAVKNILRDCLEGNYPEGVAPLRHRAQDVGSLTTRSRG